jgi:hypothetical protein
MMRSGAGLVFFFAVGAVPLVLGVIALVDATRRSDTEWARAGQNKTLWVVLIAVGFLMCIVGIVIDLVYLFSIRPQLERVETSVTPVVAAGPQAGWYPDPYSRHELRYFDGTQWSDHISDAGVPGIDSPR